VVPVTGVAVEPGVAGAVVAVPAGAVVVVPAGAVVVVPAGAVELPAAGVVAIVTGEGPPPVVLPAPHPAKTVAPTKTTPGNRKILFKSTRPFVYRRQLANRGFFRLSP
jgi:hypothetical protein